MVTTLFAVRMRREARPDAPTRFASAARMDGVKPDLVTAEFCGRYVIWHIRDQFTLQKACIR